MPIKEIIMIEANCNGCSKGRLLGKEWTWREFANESLLKMIRKQKNIRGEKCFKDIKVLRKK